MPQLNLKVPGFWRWGGFFAARDQNFFNALHKFPCRAASISNSEITWLVYLFTRAKDGGFPIGISMCD